MSGPGYEVEYAPDGTVIQSSVVSGASDWDNTMGWIARAVVLKTYFTDDPTWQDKGWASATAKVVACDIRVFGRRSRPLKRVPVAQRAAGLFDEDLYIPRDSSQDIQGGALTAESTPTGVRPTPAEQCDGDQVLVGFLECDPHQPFIFPFCLSHPEARNPPTAADGRVRRIRHHGTILEFDQNGNLTIDASNAAMPALGPSGTEVTPNPSGGNVTFKSNATGTIHLDTSNVKLADGTDAVLKGDSYWAQEDPVLDELSKFALAVTASPAGVPSTDLVAAIGTMRSGSSGWLSAKTKTG
jgi:hypothetical protein